VTPVVGHFWSKSVSTLYPLLQQFLVVGELVQLGSVSGSTVKVAAAEEVVFVERPKRRGAP